MGQYVWIALLGLLAGAIAKAILPGQVKSGWVPTLILGIAGSILGGFLGSILGFGDVTGFSPRSLAAGCWWGVPDHLSAAPVDEAVSCGILPGKA